MARAWASSVTSVSSTSTWSRPMRSASSSRRSRRRAATATRAPCAAREMAVACPMPLEAPVTRATVPSSRSVMGGLPSSSPRTRRPGVSDEVYRGGTRRPTAPRDGAPVRRPTCCERRREFRRRPRGRIEVSKGRPVAAGLSWSAHQSVLLYRLSRTSHEGSMHTRPVPKDSGGIAPDSPSASIDPSSAIRRSTIPPLSLLAPPAPRPDGVPSLRTASRRPALE